MMGHLITRRTLIGSLLATCALVASETALAQGMPIMEGGLTGPNPQRIFADLIQRSLTRDPSGQASIPGATGSFARPIDVYETLHRFHPDAGPGFANSAPTREDLREMVGYIRTLELVQLRESGRYYNTRILGRGASRRIDFEYAITLPAGTWVLVDRNTGVAIFKRNCANGLRRIELCVYVNFEVRHPGEFAVIWARYRQATDHCFAYRRVDRLFAAGSSGPAWNEVPRGCIGIPCDLTAVNRALGSQPRSQGQIPLDSPGFYQIRLMPEELLVLCVKLRTQGGVVSSFASGVRWQQDYRLISGEWHARVYYESSEVLADSLQLNAPKGLAFWASNPEAQAQMRGLAVRRGVVAM